LWTISTLGFWTSFLQDAGLPQFWHTTAEEWERACRQCTESLSRYHVQDWLASFWGPLQSVSSWRRIRPTRRNAASAPPPRGRPSPSSGRPPVLKDAPEGSPVYHFDYGRGSELASTTVHEFGHTYLGVARNQIHALARETEEFCALLQFKGTSRLRGVAMQLEEAILNATQAVWQTEEESRAAADDVIAWTCAPTPHDPAPIYQALLEARKSGKDPGRRDGRPDYGRCPQTAQPELVSAAGAAQ